MFDDMTIRFLHGGCSLLVGSVNADGRPHAGRGWGLTVVDRGRVHVATAGQCRRHAHGREPAARCRGGHLHRRRRDAAIAADEGPRARRRAGRRSRSRQAAAVHGRFHRRHPQTDGEPMEMLRRWADCPVIAVRRRRSTTRSTRRPGRRPALDWRRPHRDRTAHLARPAAVLRRSRSRRHRHVQRCGHPQHHLPVGGAAGRRRADRALQPVHVEDVAELGREPVGLARAARPDQLLRVPLDRSATSAPIDVAPCSSGCATTSTRSPR